MNEEEFYFEDENPKKTKITLLICLIIITIGIVLFTYYSKVYAFNVKDRVYYEIGSEIDYDLDKYINNKIVDEDDYELSFNGVPQTDGVLLECGEYQYKVKYRNITKKGKLIVEDTTKPEVETRELTIGVKEDYSLDEFITKCEDYSKPCLISYKSSKDENIHKKAGTYAIDIIIKDQMGNKTNKTVRLNVKKNYSREAIKQNDLKAHHITVDHGDWNNELFLKYTKAVNEDTLDDNERYTYLLELTSEDMSIYLSEPYKDNQIEEQEIIFVYNKYDYIIGFAIRVKLDNGKYIYLTK